MGLMAQNYLNPPVDARTYFSNPETVTADGGSESYFDAGGVNCFPGQAFLVIEPFTVDSGESITIKVQMDDNSSFSSATDVLTVGVFTSTQTKQTVVPLSNTRITERYTRLYYDVTTSDSIVMTSYLTVAP